MTTKDTFDRRLTDWLDEDSAHRVPDHLAEVLLRTAATRQRSRWSSLEGWLPMDATLTAPRSIAFRPASTLVIVALVILATIAAILIAGSRPRLPAPFGPAANGVLLYSADGDIHVADADGRHGRVLVGGPELDGVPTPSRDGTRFAFFRLRAQPGIGEIPADIYVADIDGRNVRRLTMAPLGYGAWLDWSPDGTELLISHFAGGEEKPALSLVRVEGAPEVRGLLLDGIAPGRPSWRGPDGREIVFSGTKDGLHSIYAVDRAGGQPRALAPLLAEVEPENPQVNYGYLGPRVSPDGGRVTYQSCFRPEAIARKTETSRYRCEIHVLDIESGVDRRVGFDPTAGSEGSPQFSPDGTSILFARGTDPGFRLVIAPADGDGRDQGRSFGPMQTWGAYAHEFSPDGRRVVLAQTEWEFESDRRMQVIDVATGEVVVGEFGHLANWQRLAP